MSRSSCTTIALALVLCAGPAFAQAKFQFAVPNFRAPDSPDVSGMRLSLLWGENQSQRGFDAGLLSLSETSTFSGMGLILGVSKIDVQMSDGAVFSLVNWHKGRDAGFNGAFLNLLHEPSGAFNLGFVTVSDGSSGVDFGGFNMSNRSKAQIGFLNVTDEIETFQFGFLNIAKNGFLPIFPVFNFPRHTRATTSPHPGKQGSARVAPGAATDADP